MRPISEHASQGTKYREQCFLQRDGSPEWVHPIPSLSQVRSFVTPCAGEPHGAYISAATTRPRQYNSKLAGSLSSRCWSGRGWLSQATSTPKYSAKVFCAANSASTSAATRPPACHSWISVTSCASNSLSALAADLVHGSRNSCSRTKQRASSTSCS